MKIFDHSLFSILFGAALLLTACGEPQAPDIQKIMQDEDSRAQIMNTISQDPELASEMMVEMMESGPMHMRDSLMLSHMSDEKFTHEMMQGYPGMMHSMMAHMMGSMSTDSVRYMKMHQMMMKDDNYRMMMHNWCQGMETDQMPHHMNQ